MYSIAGDVGQLLYEEINVMKKGANYCWNLKDGYTCFNVEHPFENFSPGFSTWVIFYGPVGGEGSLSK